MKNYININIKLSLEPNEVGSFIKLISEKEQRSFSNTVKKILKDYMDRNKKSDPLPLFDGK